MKKIDRRLHAYKLWSASNSEISESIVKGMGSANFYFESERYSFDITMYPDNVTLISIWDIKNDCPVNLPNVCKFIEDSVAKWDDVCFSRKMREIQLSDEWEMRKTG